MTEQKKTQDEIWDMFDFDQTMAKFVMDEPFYAAISSIIRKIPTTRCRTAYATVKNLEPQIFYNPEFLMRLNWKERQGIIIHEILHILFGHLTTRVKLDGNKVDMVWNWSCDLAINSLIQKDYRLKGILVPGEWIELTDEIKENLSEAEIAANEKVGEVIRQFPPGESSDWYYSKLKDPNTMDQNALATVCEMFDPFSSSYKYLEDILNNDDHSFWKEMSEEQKELLRDHIKCKLNEALDYAESRGGKHWGSFPSQCAEMLKKLYSNQVNWETILNQFIGRNISTHRTSTIKKINKRYPYIHPGSKQETIANILIAFDQSGSVSDDDVSLFFGELDNLSKSVTFYILPFDVMVDESKIIEWQEGQKKPVRRDFCGGTDFNVPQKWANEHAKDFDAVIFMTDGGCSKPIASLLPRAWILSPNQELMFETDELVIKMDRRH